MNIVDDYKRHGYKLTKNENGVMEFDCDHKYNKQHIDRELAKTHPIFDEDSKGMRSKVIIKSICGRCNAPIIDNKCSKCGREIKIIDHKMHIPTLGELKSQQFKE